jgi:hypothetical protein
MGIRDGGAQECHAHILVITTSPPLGLFGPENATTTTTSPPKKPKKNNKNLKGENGRRLFCLRIPGHSLSGEACVA